LGGFISQTEWLGGNVHDLFDSISFAENAAMTKDYRCVFVRSLETIRTLTDARLYFAEQTDGGSDVLTGLDQIGVVSSFTVAAQAYRIAVETAVPVGVTFTNPTTYDNGIEVGTIGPTDCFAVWFKRNALGETPLDGDMARIVVEGIVE
jgi:hypothetical protein